MKYLISYERAPYLCKSTTHQQVMTVIDFAKLVKAEAKNHVDVTLVAAIRLTTAEARKVSLLLREAHKCSENDEEDL